MFWIVLIVLKLVLAGAALVLLVPAGATVYPWSSGLVTDLKHFADQVDTGLQEGEKKMIGFFNCTHLHAPEGKTPCCPAASPVAGSENPSLSLSHSGDGVIRCEQLDLLTRWIGEFRAARTQQDESVAFDVLCGDFNFDNCSPGASGGYVWGQGSHV